MYVKGLLVGVVVLCGCAVVPHESVLTERQNAFSAALDAKDADVVAGMFTSDAVYHVANMPTIHGRDAIRDFYSNLLGFLSDSHHEASRIIYSEDGNMGLETGGSSNRFRTPHGDRLFEGKYAIVWHRISGKWMITYYSTSSDRAEATAAPASAAR